MTTVCFNFKGTELQNFIDRINKININKNKVGFNLCILKDIIILYNDICYHLQKFTTYPFNNSQYCQIPLNPNDIDNSGNPLVFPQTGNFNGQINEGNLADARTNYSCYFPGSTNMKPSILDQVVSLFECIIKPAKLCNIENQFANELMLLQGSINNCPVEDLIIFWKTVCIYLSGLLYSTNYDINNITIYLDQNCKLIQPGPRCDMPAVPEGIYDNINCIVPVIAQDYNNPDILKLLEQYIFVPIDGFVLYNIINIHYRTVYRTIVLPLCTLIGKLNQNVVAEKNKLIPFDIKTLLDTSDCGDPNGLKVKQLFGTEYEITSLLNQVCLKIDTIHNYYKETVIIVSPNSNNSYFLFTEIQNDHPEWIILGFIPNPSGPGFVFTIVNRNIIETKIKDVLDELDICKTELKLFLDELNACRQLAKIEYENKEIKTEEILNRLKDVLDKFKSSSQDKDKYVNVDNSKVDINLLTSYKRYLSCLTMLRCSLVTCLTEFDTTIDKINLEHENFCDILICSVYYKCLIVNRWMSVEDKKHKKLPNGFN